MCAQRDKERVNVNLPEGLKGAAKDAGLNLSRTLENALREKLGVFDKSFSEKDLVRPAGFEPAYRTRPFLEKNVDEKTLVSDFEEYLSIERDKAEKTVRQHVGNAEEILEFTGGDINRQNLRDYVKQFKGEASAYHVANKVKSIRVFTRYLGIGELGKRFKIPNPPPQPNPAPKDGDVKKQFRATGKENVAALYLTLASSGLRIGEARELREGDIDFETGMLTPRSRSREKKVGITFANDEALEAIRQLPEYDRGGVFGRHYKSKDHYWFDKAREKAGTDIRPKDLRVWFADKMGRLGVQDRYIDAFCGRVPQSVLGSHYTDFSPSKLREIYEDADLKVLE